MGSKQSKTLPSVESKQPKMTSLNDKPNQERESKEAKQTTKNDDKNMQDWNQWYSVTLEEEKKITPPPVLIPLGNLPSFPPRPRHTLFTIYNLDFDWNMSERTILKLDRVKLSLTKSTTSRGFLKALSQSPNQIWSLSDFRGMEIPYQKDKISSLSGIMFILNHKIYRIKFQNGNPSSNAWKHLFDIEHYTPDPTFSPFYTPSNILDYYNLFYSLSVPQASHISQRSRLLLAFYFIRVNSRYFADVHLIKCQHLTCGSFWSTSTQYLEALYKEIDYLGSQQDNDANIIAREKHYRTSLLGHGHCYLDYLESNFTIN